MKKIALLALLLGLIPATAQNPQTQTAPIYSVNAKYVNGVAPGYAPTIDAGGGPFLDLGPGTSFCGTSLHIYPSGIYQLTVNTTNYIYLDTTASCIPTVSTSTFTSTQIPIAIVTVSAIGNITGIVDARTPFNSNAVSGSFCSLGGCTLTGLLTVPSFVINGSSTVTGIQGTDTNLMSSGTISGSAGTAVCLDSNSGLTTTSCGGAAGNATSIQGVAVSSTPPTDGYGLVYNVSALQWQPLNLSAKYCALAGCTLSANLNTPSIVINGGPISSHVQGTDTSLMSSGTVSGSAGTAVCLDSNGGLTTTSCSASGNATQLQGVNISATPPTDGYGLVYNVSALQWQPLNLSAKYCPVAGCTYSANINVPSIVINGGPITNGVQGTDTKFMSSGTVSGSAGTIVCLDANGGLTTSGCPSAGTAVTTNVLIPITTISAASCSVSATTFTFTGTTTSLGAWWSQTGDISGLTGYGASNGIVIDVWISATNQGSYKLCNVTSASITTSAITVRMNAL